MIANRKPTNVGPNSRDHASALVAQHKWWLTDQNTVEDMGITVAKARGQRPHKDFTPDRLIMFYLGNSEGWGRRRSPSAWSRCRPAR